MEMDLSYHTFYSENAVFFFYCTFLLCLLEGKPTLVSLQSD